MKNNMRIKNVKQPNTVGQLKQLLKNYSDETEIVSETNNAVTELYVGVTHPVGGRDVEEQNILIFGGNRG